jgi:membrane-associated phospholipid phosphatase
MTNSVASRASLLQVLVILGISVTALMTIYASTGGLFPGDTRISHAIQAVDATGAGALATFMNTAFDAPTLIAITAVLSIILGVLGRYPQMFLLAATTLSQIANALLKLAVGRPRPEDGVVRVTEQASGLSFPSGHTMGTVVFFGIIFYLSFQLISHRHLRLLVQVLAISQMVAIGFSRVYTGAHWPSDVLGGFLWGAWFIVILIAAHHRYYPRLAAWFAGLRAA